MIVKLNAKRVADLEHISGKSTKSHVVHCPPGTDRDQAINVYGKEKIGPRDRVIIVPLPQTALDR